MIKQLNRSNKGPPCEREQGERRKGAVLPYVQNILHRLEKVAAGYGVDVFTARDKLGRICGSVARKLGGERKVSDESVVKHWDP